MRRGGEGQKGGERESEGGSLRNGTCGEDRALARRESSMERAVTTGGRGRGQRGNTGLPGDRQPTGCPWRLIASLQRRMTSRDATALDRSSPGRASCRPSPSPPALQEEGVPLTPT